MKHATTTPFHGGQIAQADRELLTQVKRTTIVDRQLQYRFHAHFHPYVHELVHELVEKSVRGLQAADTEFEGVTLPDGKPRPVLYEELFTTNQYDPSPLVVDTPAEPYPVKDLDFTSSGAYSVYNWELFYHSNRSPIASENEGQRWRTPA